VGNLIWIFEEVSAHIRCLGGGC